MWVQHCDQFEVVLPDGHRFPMEKYARLRRTLLDRGVLRPADLHASAPADLTDVTRAHTSSYVRAVVDGTLDSKAMRRIGLPWSPALVARSLASVGGTVAAAQAALKHGFAGTLSGGTHHAFADAGAGYCVFNDLAVAAHALLASGRVQRILIVDVDVHQGDGTAVLFAEDPRVFTFSMHGAKNFPFHKQRSDLDVELPDGTDDVGYLRLLAPALDQAIARARPQFAFVQGGVDPLASDTLGRLSLSFTGLRARDELVLRTLRDRHIPTVLTLGGGYAKPLDDSIEAHVGTYEIARALFG